MRREQTEAGGGSEAEKGKGCVQGRVRVAEWGAGGQSLGPLERALLEGADRTVLSGVNFCRWRVIGTLCACGQAPSAVLV